MRTLIFPRSAHSEIFGQQSAGSASSQHRSSPALDRSSSKAAADHSTHTRRPHTAHPSNKPSTTNPPNEHHAPLCPRVPAAVPPPSRPCPSYLGAMPTGCSWLQIPYDFSRKLMKLAAAVLTGDSVLNSVLTAVNRQIEDWLLLLKWVIGLWCNPNLQASQLTHSHQLPCVQLTAHTGRQASSLAS